MRTRTLVSSYNKRINNNNAIEMSLSWTFCVSTFFDFVLVVGWLHQWIGPIKELRDTPWKKNQRFVEFFDTRDAAKALKHMNGKQIHGKPIIIEFSRPGGHTRRFFHHSPSSKTSLDFNAPPPAFPPSPPRRFAAPPRSQPQLSRNKSLGSPVKGEESVDEAIGSMSLTGDVGNGVEEEQHSHGGGPPRRNLSRKQSCETTLVVATAKQQQQQPQQIPRTRHWKGKQAKKHEARFLIKEDAIVESGPKDPRTTVMIKNIPNKYRSVFLFYIYIFYYTPLLRFLLFLFLLMLPPRMNLT